MSHLRDAEVINVLSKYCMVSSDFRRFILDIGVIEEMTKESDNDNWLPELNSPFAAAYYMKANFQTLEIFYVSKSSNVKDDIGFKLNEMNGLITEQNVGYGNWEEATAIHRKIEIRFHFRNIPFWLSRLLNKNVLSEVQNRAFAYEVLQ